MWILFLVVLLPVVVVSALTFYYHTKFQRTDAYVWREKILERYARLKREYHDADAPVRALNVDAIRNRYLIQHFETVPVEDAVKFTGIGPGTVDRLRSAGLHTLADMIGYTFEKLPGIGPAKGNDLRAAVRSLRAQAEKEFDAGQCQAARDCAREIEDVRRNLRERESDRELTLTELRKQLKAIARDVEIARSITLWHYFWHDGNFPIYSLKTAQDDALPDWLKSWRESENEAGAAEDTGDNDLLVIVIPARGDSPMSPPSGATAAEPVLDLTIQCESCGARMRVTSSKRREQFRVTCPRCQTVTKVKVPAGAPKPLPVIQPLPVATPIPPQAPERVTQIAPDVESVIAATIQKLTSAARPLPESTPIAVPEPKPDTPIAQVHESETVPAKPSQSADFLSDARLAHEKTTHLPSQPAAKSSEVAHKQKHEITVLNREQEITSNQMHACALFGLCTLQHTGSRLNSTELSLLRSLFSIIFASARIPLGEIDLIIHSSAINNCDQKKAIADVLRHGMPLDLKTFHYHVAVKLVRADILGTIKFNAAIEFLREAAKEFGIDDLHLFVIRPSPYVLTDNTSDKINLNDRGKGNGFATIGKSIEAITPKSNANESEHYSVGGFAKISTPKGTRLATGKTDKDTERESPDLFAPTQRVPPAPPPSPVEHPELPKLRAFAGFGLMIAKADGRIAKAERAAVREFLASLFAHDSQLVRHIDPVLESAEKAIPDEQQAVALILRNTKPDERRTVYQAAERIADACGNRNRQEIETLDRVAVALGVETAPKPVVLPEPPKSTATSLTYQQTHAVPPVAPSPPPAPNHRAILEIETGMELTVELIRRRFTMLFERSDPEKAALLGPEFAAMAEKKRADLRTAAEFLIAPFGTPLDPPAAPPPPSDIRHNPDLDDIFGG